MTMTSTVNEWSLMKFIYRRRVESYLITVVVDTFMSAREPG